MREQFRQYIINLYQDIPQEVYEGLLSVFCLGVVLFMVFKGVSTGFKWSSILLLIEYSSCCSVRLSSSDQQAKQANMTFIPSGATIDQSCW